MSSLGIIIDGFYIDCLAPGNVINDRRHDEPPFFFSFFLQFGKSVQYMLPTQVQLGIRVLILKQARQNIKGRLRFVPTQFCGKVAHFLLFILKTPLKGEGF